MFGFGRPQRLIELEWYSGWGETARSHAQFSSGKKGRVRGKEKAR